MSESVADQATRYPLAAYNFRVAIGDTVVSFSEVSGLVREYQTLTYKHGLSFWEGGSIAKFSYDKYVPLTLKKGVTRSSKMLYEWLDQVDKRNLSVSLCNETGAAVVIWQIKKAMIVKLEAPSLQAASNDAAIDTLTLMVSGVSVETV